MNIGKQSPQRQREMVLYRYHKALERGDFETTSAILKQAERDPQLNQMIAELDSALESESEAQTRPNDAPFISLPSSLNGQPPKPNHFQEQTNMTTQTRYWEPRQAAGRANRFAAAVVLLLTALIVGGIFFFMVPSRTSIMTMVVQQPTPTVAEIAKLYVEEVWGKGDQDLIKSLFSVDFVDHDPMFVNDSSVLSATNDKNNREVFRNNVLVLRAAFTDLSVKTEAVVLGEDKAVVRWTFTGTHKQPFLTFAATNKNVTMTNTDILSIKDGQIVERWGENKLQAMLNATEIDRVSQSATEGVTAFARFAYIFGANKIDDLGDVIADEITFNGDLLTLAQFKASVASTYTQLGGIINIKMLNATVNGNHLVGDVEFYTLQGAVRNHGIVKLTITDGKISSYEYIDG